MSRWPQVRITDIKIPLPSAKPGAVSAPDFAVDHGRTKGLLGPMVRGGDRRIDQEPEPVHRMFQEVSAKCRFGAYVNRPEASCSSSQLKAKPCMARSSRPSR